MFTNSRLTNDVLGDTASTAARPEGRGRNRRTSAAVAVLLVTAVATAGCGSDDNTAGTNTDTEPKVVNVTFNGDSVTPNGERVVVAVGQEIELKMSADKPGEIHVHTDPEQELEYTAGTSTVDIAPIEKPGIVEVESHDLDKVIIQLEAR